MRSAGIFTGEPRIRVGVLDRYEEVRGRWNGPVLVNGEGEPAGGFTVKVNGGSLELTDAAGRVLGRGAKIHCIAVENSTFTLTDVTIGIRFHWERKEEQTFRGDLTLLARGDGTVTAVNEIALEDYLASVISSEMNPEAPLELLKAHAVTSRSWLAAMLRHAPGDGMPASLSQQAAPDGGEWIRWYGREEHHLFDVCADDHCQRYQGISKIIPARSLKAVEETRGLFLLYGGSICDARYHKACGGITEDFDKVWEDRTVPYLASVSDSDRPFPLVISDDEATRWILSSPEAYCNTRDERILRQVLPSFDQETADFFRWTVIYQREEIEAILREKSGIDFGSLCDFVPLERGASGRIVRLRIDGTKATRVVGKELEIRRWLARSHLLSSAFVVEVERDPSGTPLRFVLRGAGWGHGVGLCQIGAAVMATRGFTAEDILKHYFRGVELRKLY